MFFTNDLTTIKITRCNYRVYDEDKPEEPITFTDCATTFKEIDFNQNN
jgi:hypothetical protein